MNTSVETKKVELRNELKNLFKSFKESAEKLIETVPGWKVTDIDKGCDSTIIYLSLASDERKRIVIRYQQEVEDWQNEEFSTSVPSHGSFELMDANGTALYYIAVGQLLSNTDVLTQLKKEMVNFTVKAGELRNEYKSLDQEA